MRSMTTVRMLVLAATLALMASGCYTTIAVEYRDDGGPAPWFCEPVAPNSVTGPGMGTVDYYATIAREPLDGETCVPVAAQFDLAKAYAEQYPTLADAEAAGMSAGFDFITGMGTHHGLGWITPELLQDPSFDRHDPVIPNSIVDGTFDVDQPEFLQYNGNGPDAVLVGMSYYVRTEDGQPPEGFAGPNDRWHHHPTLCLNPSTATAFRVNTTDQGCATQGGINVHMDDYFMLHVWLVDDLEYVGDVHAPTHPCIQSGGAIFDMEHPCHDSWQSDAPLDGGGVAPEVSHLPYCGLAVLADER